MAGRLPQLSRGSMALVLNALLGLLALGLAFAPAGEGSPTVQLASASGALSLSNSKEGTAIFHADAMRPGEQASGSVTITNTGTINAALTLQAENASDTPGNGGGQGQRRSRSMTRVCGQRACLSARIALIGNESVDAARWRNACLGAPEGATQTHASRIRA